MKKPPKPSFKGERKIWKKGYRYVIGVDEVGRGAFAGSVVVGAVVFDRDNCTGIIPEEINDSKLLNPQKREELDKKIRSYAQYYSISEVGISIINKVGIGKATSIAFRKAISQLIKILSKNGEKKSPGILISQYPNIFVLADGFHIKYIRGIGLKNQKAIIKGDQKSISIAAASIIAKVYRDNLMRALGEKYPHYHLRANKGYGTKKHQAAIKKYGLSKIHRKSFSLSKFL